MNYAKMKTQLGENVRGMFFYRKLSVWNTFGFLDIIFKCNRFDFFPVWLVHLYVNIRNVLKWFKCLQNVFETYLCWKCFSNNHHEMFDEQYTQNV